jgi:energy-coupling factor transporter transmembrane protein EcfT
MLYSCLLGSFVCLCCWFFVYWGLEVLVYLGLCFYLLVFLFIWILHYLMVLFMVFVADVACKRGHPYIPARRPLHDGFSPSTHPLCRFARVPPLSDTLDVVIFYSLYVGPVSTRNYYAFRPSTHTATRGGRPDLGRRPKNRKT